MIRDVEETAPADPEEPWDESTIGRYQFRRVVGQGGMGVVVAAYDPELEREVAIKLVTTRALDDEHPVREAQTMARLAHPNVVRVFEVLRIGVRTAIVMELVDGEELTTWQRQAGRTWREILDAYIQASRGLGAAHRAGIVHRDFKPSNALVDRDGVVHVTDFGIARRAVGDDARLEVAGTPAYMAPEQHRRDHVDARSDQWSLACSLYEALYGRRPFASVEAAGLADAVQRGEIDAEPADSPIPRGVRAAIRRALATDPETRFATIDDLGAALTVRPRRIPYLVAALALVVIGTIAVFWSRDAPETCRGLDGPIRDRWSAVARAQLRERLAKSSTGLPTPTIEGALDGLDDYAASWASLRTRTCTDRRKGVISAERLDARMRCLDHRLAEVSQLLEALSVGDAATLRATRDAIGQLAPLSSCIDPSTNARPTRPDLQPDIDGAELGLARANAAVSLGQYEQAIPLLESATLVGERAQFPSLTARALVLRGECEDRLGRPEVALTTYQRAARAASQARDHVVVADALARAVFVEGDHLGRRADALKARPFVELAIESAGQPDHIRAHWLHYLAILIYDDPAQVDDAARYERESLAIRRRTLPENHVYVIDSLETLANIEAARKNFDESDRLLRQVLDARIAARGPKDLSVASATSNLGILLYERKNVRGALDQFQLAVDISREAGRVNSGALFNLGVMQWELGRWTAATATFTSALAVSEQRAGEDSRDVAEAATYLAAVLVAEGDLERGRRMLHRALEVARRSAALVLSTALAMEARLAIHDRQYNKARELLDDAATLPRLYVPLHVLVEAELTQARAGCAAARPELARALEAALAESAHAIELIAHVKLAECERAAGDAPAARQRLEALLAWFEEVGADEEVRTPARAALARLDKTVRSGATR